MTDSNAAKQDDSASVYKITSLSEPDDNDKSIRITGTFPAIKDGKQIDISYNSVFARGKGFDDDGGTERVRMPQFKGYSVDQDYVKFNFQRDPETNEITGITLPNGIPTYVKNSNTTSITNVDNNEAYQMSLVYPDGRGQEGIPDSSDITPKQKSDAEKWLSQMKNSFRVTKDIPLLTSGDISAVYIGGSDGWFNLGGAETLTPQSNQPTPQNNFFEHFNDNRDGSDIFFNPMDTYNYNVFATATANDKSIKRNLTVAEINQFLEDKNGKGVTFHFGVHYVENFVMGNGGWDQYLKDGSKQLAHKDVVVLPLQESNTNSNTGKDTNTGNSGSHTHTNGNTHTNNNANTNNNNTHTNTTTDSDNDKATIPAASYHSVFTPVSGTELYSDNGQLLKSVSLGVNTAWQVDKKQTIKGVTYLRVATNEWVKVDNGLEVQLHDSVVTTNKQATLYKSNGTRVRNRALATNTDWKSDRIAQINNHTMYRVSTNEWVMESDI